MSSNHRRTRSLQPPSERGEDQSALSAHASPSHTPMPRPRDEMIVKLNVGGRKFDTTEITLFSKGHNFLTSLLSSPLPSMRDDAGRLFIDRNGNMFEILLEYLRSGALHIPPHISAAALYNEADFFGITLPGEPQRTNKLSRGLFVSSKYAENELVVFSDASTGYIVRGGSSKVQFRYRNMRPLASSSLLRLPKPLSPHLFSSILKLTHFDVHDVLVMQKTDGDGVIEVVWLIEKKPRPAQHQSSRDRLFSSSPSSASSSKQSSSQSKKGMTPSNSSSALATSDAAPSNSNSAEDISTGHAFSNSAEFSKSTVWFLQGTDLITTSSNTYSYVPNLASFPSCIFTNTKGGISIYEGLISGFRLPKSEDLPILFSSEIRRQSVEDTILESPPPNSPISDPELFLSDNSDSSDESRDAVFVDIRNHWVKCDRYTVTPYCDSVVAYQIVCRPIESVRYKNSLPFSMGGTNEYEWCREKLTFEVIVLPEHIIARLASYSLMRKDRSKVAMQYSAAFHKFYKIGRSGNGTGASSSNSES